MNYRQALLLASKDVGEAGTEVFDIDVKKPISRIDIKWRITKVLEEMTAPAPADITKIEIVDGSKPLFSLSGYEAQALNYYSRRTGQMGHGQFLPGNSQETHFGIDFGRRLWDPELAFLAGNFSNPQLRITYNEAVSDTSAEANQLEVWSSIFDEKEISPVGFLSAIEHFSYSCGDEDSYKDIALPEDRVIRQMLVRAYQDGYEPWNQIAEARFDENTLDKIPWDYTSLENYHRRTKGEYPPIQFAFVARSGAPAKVVYVPATDYWVNVMLQTQSAAPVAYNSPATGKGGKLGLEQASGENDLFGLITGWLPWHCFQFPMGQPAEIDDWYNPVGKKPRLRLRAGAGGTSGTGQVVLEELRRY